VNLASSPRLSVEFSLGSFRSSNTPAQASRSHCAGEDEHRLRLAIAAGRAICSSSCRSRSPSSCLSSFDVYRTHETTGCMKGANGDFRPEPAAVATSALVNGGSGQHRRRPDSKSLTLRVKRGRWGRYSVPSGKRSPSIRGIDEWWAANSIVGSPRETSQLFLQWRNVN